MSAYVVDKTHIDLLVATALDGPRGLAVSPDNAWHRPSWWAGDPRAAFAEAGGGDKGWEAMNALRREAVLHDDLDAFGGQPGVGPNALGQLLVMECVASVSHRYPGDDVSAGELPGPIDAYYVEPYSFGFERPAYRLTAVEALSAIACYRYQSCEHPGWEASEAFAFCGALEAGCISHLPGYRDAPWSWDAEKVAERRAVGA